MKTSATRASAVPRPQTTPAPSKPIVVSSTGVLAREKSTLGSRLKEARERAGLTQQELASKLPSPRDRDISMSRANIAQYESDTVIPPIPTVAEIERLLNVPPAFISYGLGASATGAEIAAELAAVPEFVFGAGPDVREKIHEWKLPKEWLRASLRVPSFDNLFIYQCEAGNMAPQYEYGDKLVIDGHDLRGSGTYLHWDGTGPAINRIVVIPKAGGVSMARVSSADSRGDSYEVPITDIMLLGRVRGVWKAS